MTLLSTFKHRSVVSYWNFLVKILREFLISPTRGPNYVSLNNANYQL